VKTLEDEVKALRGQCIVGPERNEREKYILQEIMKASESLLCKFHKAPKVALLAETIVFDFLLM
jgi:hypothetical protein